MNNIDIQVISREIITPSTPTPNDLNKYTLSYLDQLNPPVFMPHVLFYPDNTNSFNNSDISTNLKKSLSKTLSLYYPLSGRRVGNTYIDCNDEGVTFVEARANCKLMDVIMAPVPKEFNKFLPSDMDEIGDQCLVLQATFFSCGGFAIGIGFSHKLGDGWSLFMFLNSWASVSRGGDNPVLTPLLDSATLFPPRDLDGFDTAINIMKRDNIVTKRFSFSASKIDELIDMYTKKINNDVLVARRPTRIQALSAFIWTRFVVSTGLKDDPTKICTLNHAVNMRKRADPPLPDNLFGNLYRPVFSMPSLKDDDNEDTYNTYKIVETMNEEIKSIDGDFIRKLQVGSEHLGFINKQAKKVMSGGVISFSFTSLCRFPLYEADFGWGKPVWVGAATHAYKNVVFFLDSYSGNGIEAWVNLKPEDMEKFQVDKDLLAYATN